MTLYASREERLAAHVCLKSLSLRVRFQTPRFGKIGPFHRALESARVPWHFSHNTIDSPTHQSEPTLKKNERHSTDSQGCHRRWRSSARASAGVVRLWPSFESQTRIYPPTLAVFRVAWVVHAEYIQGGLSSRFKVSAPRDVGRRGPRLARGRRGPRSTTRVCVRELSLDRRSVVPKPASTQWLSLLTKNETLLSVGGRRVGGW